MSLIDHIEQHERKLDHFLNTKFGFLIDSLKTWEKDMKESAFYIRRALQISSDRDTVFSVREELVKDIDQLRILESLVENLINDAGFAYKKPTVLGVHFSNDHGSTRSTPTEPARTPLTSQVPIYDSFSTNQYTCGNQPSHYHTADCLNTADHRDGTRTPEPRGYSTYGRTSTNPHVQVSSMTDRDRRAMERQLQKEERDASVREEVNNFKSTSQVETDNLARSTLDYQNKHQDRVHYQQYQEQERQRAAKEAEINEKLSRDEKYKREDLERKLRERNALQNYQSDTNRMYHEHERNMTDISATTAANVRTQQMAADENIQAMHQEKRAFDEEIRNMENRMRQEQEESDRLWEERSRKIDEQYARIFEVLRLKVWNAAIENNWANRLNFMRSCNKEVMRKYSDLSATISRIKNEGPIGSRIAALINMRILALKNAATAEMRMIEKEIRSLEEMFAMSHKTFIKEILISLAVVREQCSKLLSKLYDLNENDTAYNVKVRKTEIKKLCSNVQAAVDKIPTLKYLKDRHNLKKDKSSSANPQPLTDYFVQIEEIF